MTSSEDPCDWGAESPCVTCRRQQCPDCRDGEPCTQCLDTRDNTCFAVCTEEVEPGFEVKHVNFSHWPEHYAAVRCLRRRNNTRGLNFFPGFCKYHASKVYIGVNHDWNSLSSSEQDLLLYMISTDQCAMTHFNGFISQPPYNSISPDRIWQLMFSPMAITSVHPNYYFFFLWAELSRQVIQKGVQRLQEDEARGVDTDDADYQQRAFQHVQSEFSAVDYGWLVEKMAQPWLLAWLNVADEGLRLMHWNLLNSKLVQMFAVGLPPQYQAWVLPFSDDWSKVWTAVALNTFGTDESGTPYFSRPEFSTLWVELMIQMQAVAAMTNRAIPEGQEVPSLPMETLLAQGKLCQTHAEEAMKLQKSK